MPSPHEHHTVGMALAVISSAAGMAVHTVSEFGSVGLLNLDTGMIPVVTVQVVLFILWWLVPTGRSALALALLTTAVLQLVGGAIISVLPLPFLPFEPEQTIRHYVAHVFLGITQIPLIVTPLKRRKDRREPAEGKR